MTRIQLLNLRWCESDAAECKGELFGLHHIRDVPRVNICTPAVITADTHLLADGTDNRVMHQRQLIGMLGVFHLMRGIRQGGEHHRLLGIGSEQQATTLTVNDLCPALRRANNPRRKGQSG